MKEILGGLAYDLCAINSISFDESEVISYAAAWLKKAGMMVELIGDAHRSNIFAYYKQQDCYSVIYCTHLDTVAPYIAPRWQDDILRGRGACDAKGIAASMIMALFEQKKAGFTDLALLLTVGEEEASDGAKACCPRLAGRAQYLVVGEPTELKAAYAQKGSLVFDLLAKGIEAHSAMPELGNSAISHLVDSLYTLSHQAWPANQSYGETLFNAGLIKGGSMRNILAKSAEAHCVMRLSEPADNIINIIKNIIPTNIEFNILSFSDPFLYVVPPGFDSFLAGFGSDAPYLSQLGQPILLGPGSLKLAHQAHEHININELVAGVAAYQKIAMWARAEEQEDL